MIQHCRYQTGEIYNMSTKFEQLLDLLVNEDMEGANALFHEIVVDKSRDIYENLIAEEEADENADLEEADENADLEEAEEEAEESLELEDAYSMEADDGFSGGKEGDDADEFGASIGMNADDDNEMPDHEKGEDNAIMDIKNAIQELEAAFAELEAAQGAEKSEMDWDDSEEDNQDDEYMKMGMPMEGRRMTREYVEKVAHTAWEKGGQKEQGALAGGGTGEQLSKPKHDNKSPVNGNDPKRPSGGKVNSDVLKDTSTHDEDGTKPHGKVGGLVKSGGEFTDAAGNWKQNSAPGANAGKTAFKQKVKDAYGLAGDTRNNGSEGHGVGAQTGGEKAGQTGGNTNARSIESGKGR